MARLGREKVLLIMKHNNHITYENTRAAERYAGISEEDRERQRQRGWGATVSLCISIDLGMAEEN